jgi:hypothetical protein
MSAEEIEKLAKLRDQGVLTEEEFETERRSVLARFEREAMLAQRQQAPGAPLVSGEAAPKTSVLAVVALILSIFCVVGSILGVVALVSMRKNPHLRGKGLAIASIPLGICIGLGMSSAVAIPAFIKYIRKSKTVEATEALDRIAANARSVFAQQGSFPAATTDWVPATSCCMDATSAPKCSPDPQAWSGAPWQQLGFALPDPHYYQYKYSGSGRSFVAEARGDLDCDGTYSSYRIIGGVSPDGQVQIQGPIIQDEIE